MSHLSQLQTDFQAYLLNDAQGVNFINAIVNDQKVGATKRLSIYANAYRLRIIEALATAYPKLHSLLGDDYFDSTARSYIKQYPSTYRNMRWVGGEMAAHLQATLPQHAIVSEMAQFEWALGLAFDAEDAPVLSLQDLVAIPPENWADLRFNLHPSAQLLAFKWNVLTVWQALDVDEAVPKFKKINKPCLVWRQNMGSYFRTITEAELQAFHWVIAGASFGELCENLQENGDAQNATIQAAQYLSAWLESGLLSNI